MKHLPIPFEQIAWITIRQKGQVVHQRLIEAATTPVEHFQCLLYRDKLDPGGGLALIFENPNLPALVSTRVNFPVDAIQVDDAGNITHLGMLLPSEGTGSFVTTYQANYLLLLPHGFIKEHALLTANESRERKRTPFELTVQISTDIRVGVYRTVKDRFLGMHDQERLSRFHKLINGAPPTEFDDLLKAWFYNRY